jgi:glutamyl-Q tRNA(Asp) synthetase
MSQSRVTRFAPSPTGPLHLGHAYAALYAYNRAKNGRFLVRIEDIDYQRACSKWVEKIFDDLEWLGLIWEKPVRFQSKHSDEYEKQLNILADKKLLYHCFCSRKDILSAVSAPQGPHGPVYSGHCKTLSSEQLHRLKENGVSYCLRLNVDKAYQIAKQKTSSLRWFDQQKGWQETNPFIFGDIVLARKTIATSYHLAVTIDDAIQGVNLVTRGADLFTSTHIHRLLQEILELPVPEWDHHQLILDDDGNKLSKSLGSKSLNTLRLEGWSLTKLYDYCRDLDLAI